jgi:hypothetical protein
MHLEGEGSLHIQERDLNSAAYSKPASLCEFGRYTRYYLLYRNASPALFYIARRIRISHINSVPRGKRERVDIRKISNNLIIRHGARRREAVSIVSTSKTTCPSAVRIYDWMDWMA